MQDSKPKQEIPKAPVGWKRLVWLGPSFLWMLSAAGSGEVLFTPRIAAMYGYALLWALLAAVLLKWFINREVGRYTVSTGNNIMVGFHQLPGPPNWAIWIILLPQSIVAVTTIAGMSGAAANALTVLMGGSALYLTIGIIAITGAIVLIGRYKVVEKIASLCGVLLSLAVMIAAISVFPSGEEMAQGLIPNVTADIKYEEVLPWLGFMLAGAAGLIWYSNWVQARGYGSAATDSQPRNVKQISAEENDRLQNWLTQMTISNTLAVTGALLIAIAFLILGAELLRPEGLIPKEEQMSEVLGKLLGNVWGPAGFWFMIVAIFITFWTTALTNQDGWGRMFSSGTKLLFDQFGISASWNKERILRRAYIIVLLVIFPVILFIFFGKPLGLLKVAGAIEAAHIPVVAGLTLYLNYKTLPAALQPSRVSFLATATAGLFFLCFAAFYILQLMRGNI